MSGPVCECDYERVIVRKPWGFEYLMYQNDHLGLWCLHIRNGARTSLHCHPRKKTGLLLLSGETTITFLNDSTRLLAPGKMMIRPGLFHSTCATSPNGAVVLEVETPRDKENLVRLEDEYGRKEQPYEGAEAMTPLPQDCPRLPEAQEGADRVLFLHGCALTLRRTFQAAEFGRELTNEMILVLDGGLFSRDGEPVLSAGDIIGPATWNRLAQNFGAPQGISLMTIRKQRPGEGENK